jgi:excisionase family DNA binding protein
MPLAVSVDRASAEYIDLSPATIRRLIARGEFPHIRVETRVLVPVAALAQWVEQRTIAAGSSPPPG